MACSLLKPYRTEISDHSLDSVSLVRAKEHLLIYEDDFDSIISRYTRTATSTLEEWMGYYAMPATAKACFGYCSQCSTAYVLSKRPFNSVVSVEVLIDGSYEALTPEQYSVVEDDWDAFVTLCEDITPDTDCGDVDPIVITYKVGEYTELNVVDITSTLNVALAQVDGVHNLINGDQVIVSGTGEPDLEGTFSITVTGSASFQYTYVGTSDLNTISGLVTIPHIPPQIEQSILLMVAGMYNNRGDCSDSCGPVPCAVQVMAGQFRRVRIDSSRGKYGCECG